VLRAGLVAGAAAVLSSCGVRVGSPSRPAAPPPPGPDELARERVAEDADALRALAARAAALVPADRALLGAIAADHRAHAAALWPAFAAGRSVGTTAGSASSSTSGSAPTSATSAGVPPSDGSPTTRGTPVPLTAATALPALLRAERAAAAAATAELDRVSGDVARLLASVAASRSLHVRTLTPRLAAASATRDQRR
jgi:hypothetical protein